MLNIAIIGLGNIGKSHIKAIPNSKSCRICAVCDSNEELAKQHAEALGVPYFLDYKDIPGGVELDAALITLPHFLHCESAIFFLERGIHVFMEKPMANTVEECDKMIAAAKANNVKLAIAHPQRFFYANTLVKEFVDSKKLGELCMFTEFRTTDYFTPGRPKWFLNKKQAGGGIVMNFGAHAIDKLFYVLGETKDIEVFASTANIKNDADIEGHAQFMMKFPSGVTGTVTFSGYNTCGYDAIYYFTDGALKVSDTSLLYQFKDGKWEQIDTTTSVAPLLYQIEEFCKYVNNEPSIVPDGEFGRDVIAVIEKVYND